MTRTASSASAPPDLDRVGVRTPVTEVVRRRLDGRYPLDAFGADPHLQDLLTPFVSGAVALVVHHPERLPHSGPGLLVANRGLGVAEPVVLALAVQRTLGRRLRVVGAPDLAVVGGAARKLGAIGRRGDEVAVALRAGHLVVAPLARRWLRTGAGEPPRSVLAAAIGAPVVPVAITPGGPLGLPLRPWQVRIGSPFEAPADTLRGDPLAAAELAERVREAVAELLAEE